MYTLFLDDERFPSDNIKGVVIICRSSREAIDCVIKNGFPWSICFDHDLGGEDTSVIFINWMIDYLLDNNKKLPVDFNYSVHSMNPIGSDRIKSIMIQVVREFKY